MGYMRHHTIVVCSWSRDSLRMAHRKAQDICPYGLVSPIVDALVNGYASFFVAPDGSKEGWPESDKCDDARAAFIEWLNEHEDGSSSLDWAEMFFGDDAGEAEIVRHKDEAREARRARGG